MNTPLDLRSARARAEVFATARRIGLYDSRSTSFHMAYLLAEAGLLPDPLVRAAERAAARLGASDDAVQALTALAQVGWVVPSVAPPSRGRPLHWRVTDRGRVEMVSFTEARAQSTPGQFVGWARYFLARALCLGEQDETWSTPQLVTDVQHLAYGAARLELAAATVRKELRFFERSGWVSRHAGIAGVADEPWRLTTAGVRALACLALRKGCPLPRRPRQLRPQDRIHDLRAARVAAALLPAATGIGAVAMGRRLNFDAARRPAGGRGTAGFCLPDVTATVTTAGRRRLVCVEIERTGALPGLERHLAAYAGFAMSWVGLPSHPDELLVAFVSTHQAVRRDAIRRIVNTLPGPTRSLPWRVVVVGIRDVRTLTTGPLDCFAQR